MRVAWLLVALVGAACTNSGPKPVPAAACPGDGWFEEHIPLFPGTKLEMKHATTRGRLDSTTYTAELDAPYEQVLEFYARCLGTRASIVGKRASFAHPVLGDLWVPMDQVTNVVGEPRDMSHTVTLTPRADGGASMFVSIASPWGYGRGPALPR